jgi:hypothetical protein
MADPVTVSPLTNFVMIWAAIAQTAAVLVALRSWRIFRGASIVIHNDRGSLTPIRFGNGEPGKTYFYHGKVVTRFGSLKNARVYLVGARKQVAGGRFDEILFPVPHQLVWAPEQVHREATGLDVNKERIFDLGRIIGPPLAKSFEPRIYSPVAYIDFVSVHASETLRYDLQIDAEGFQSKKFQFEVAWNGQWNERPEEMRKNVSIKTL